MSNKKISQEKFAERLNEPSCKANHQKGKGRCNLVVRLADCSPLAVSALTLQLTEGVCIDVQLGSPELAIRIQSSRTPRRGDKRIVMSYKERRLHSALARRNVRQIGEWTVWTPLDSSLIDEL